MIREMNSGWKKRELLPLPVMLADTETPVISLDGTWAYKRTVLEESIGIDKSDWRAIELPCDISNAVDAVSDGTRQVKTGVLISEGVTGLDTWVDADAEEGSAFVFSRRVTIPEAFSGKRIFLRFDGTNYFSTVYVDEHKAAEHTGGFTSWNCEISHLVSPGCDAEITLGTKDAPGRLNPDNKGGVIRPVKLFAVCEEGYIASLHAATLLDANYQDAVLKVDIEAVCAKGQQNILKLHLCDPEGQAVTGENGWEIELREGKATYHVEKEIHNPLKWDAEHPRLYTLRAELFAGGKSLERVEKRIGFRQIEIAGQRMLVNGAPVKLRGVCRQDMSARNGRAVSLADMREDIRLFKEANINFVRTTNYPPREELLDLCDEMGMYVQEEAPVAYVGQRLPASSNDPSFADEYMSQFMEMLERDKSHPCVLIWGLGNESNWGYNFRLMKDYARREDSRPLSFSYAMSCHDEKDKPDIWSCHYVSYDMDLSVKYDHLIIGHTNGQEESPGYVVGYARGNDKPVLHDEMAHVPCYDRDALMRDPAARDFWGESIKRFWEGIWKSEGALGCAIWSGIDDVSCFSGGDKLNQWGIVDVWRRPKPEYWHVKKAFSPIRVQETELPLPADGKITLHIENRYNHTDLSEVEIHYHMGGIEGKLDALQLPPGKTAAVTLPALKMEAGSELTLICTDAEGREIERSSLTLGKEMSCAPRLCDAAPQIYEDAQCIRVVGSNFEIEFSKQSGLITRGVYDGVCVLCGGPYMNMVGYQMPQWQLMEMNTFIDQHAHVRIRGLYPRIAQVCFDIAIDAEGGVYTSYTIEKKLAYMPRTVKIRVGMDPGGLDELGVYYLMPDSVDRVFWKRRGIWTVYPEDHIGRLEGMALRSYGLPEQPVYRSLSTQWSRDEQDIALFGKYDFGMRGSNDFRSTKFHIEQAVIPAGEKAGIEVLSDGSHSLRLELAPNPQDLIDCCDARVCYTGTWYAVKDPSGSLNGTEMYSRSPGAVAELAFEGTGVAWYGNHDVIGGIARVYIDDKLMDDMVSHAVEEVEKPGMSRGYERRYRRLQYAVENLPYGRHTIRIEVTGEKEAQADYAMVMVDYFRVLGTGQSGYVKLIVNNDYNSTRLAWGNYMRPAVRFDEGYQNGIFFRLGSAGSVDVG